MDFQDINGGLVPRNLKTNNSNCKRKVDPSRLYLISLASDSATNHRSLCSNYSQFIQISGCPSKAHSNTRSEESKTLRIRSNFTSLHFTSFLLPNRSSGLGERAIGSGETSRIEVRERLRRQTFITYQGRRIARPLQARPGQARPASSLH
jgi:hypothetical protein